MFEAIATAGIIFSYLGFRQGVELAGESENPKRNVPFAVIGSVAIAGLHVRAAAYRVHRRGLTGRPQPPRAGRGFEFAERLRSPRRRSRRSSGSPGWPPILYADAVISPGGTGLVYTTVTARISYAMAPHPERPRGAGEAPGPWRPVGQPIALAFVVGLIFFLPVPGWQKLVTFITSATVLSFGVGPLVWAALRKPAPRSRAPVPRPGRPRDPVPRLPPRPT